MIIGVPKEIKNHEYRLDMVPASVRELTARNHTVSSKAAQEAALAWMRQIIALSVPIFWSLQQPFSPRPDDHPDQITPHIKHA